jgi:hypothetical protein
MEGGLRVVSFARGAVLEADGSERASEPAGGAAAAPSALERDRAILRAREAGAPGLYEQLEARKEEQAALRRAPAARGLASDDAAFLNEAAEAVRRREMALQAAETDELAAFAEARKAAATAAQVVAPGAGSRNEADSNTEEPEADQAEAHAQQGGDGVEFRVLKKRRRTAATSPTPVPGAPSLDSSGPAAAAGQTEHTTERKAGHKTVDRVEHKNEHTPAPSSLLTGYASSDSDD